MWCVGVILAFPRPTMGTYYVKHCKRHLGRRTQSHMGQYIYSYIILSKQTCKSFPRGLIIYRGAVNAEGLFVIKFVQLFWGTNQVELEEPRFLTKRILLELLVVWDHRHQWAGKRVRMCTTEDTEDILRFVTSFYKNLNILICTLFVWQHGVNLYIHIFCLFE